MAHVPFYLDLGTGGGILLAAVLLVIGGLIAAIEVFCDWRDEQARRHRQSLSEMAKSRELRRAGQEVDQ